MNTTTNRGETEAERNVRILKNRATAANQAFHRAVEEFEAGRITETEVDAADAAHGAAVKAWREANLALLSK